MPDAPPPQPQPQPPPVSRQSKAFALLAGAVGIGMATTLVVDTRADEGSKPRAYRDLGSVWTVCSGSTRGVKPGEVDTAEQCDARTAADLLIAVHGVERCAPGLKDPARHSQLRAAVRFNNNTGKFCVGSPGRLMHSAQWRAGCDAMLAYDGVISARPIKGALRVRRLRDGRYFNEFRGMISRRQREHAVCVEGLPR